MWFILKSRKEKYKKKKNFAKVVKNSIHIALLNTKSYTSLLLKDIYIALRMLRSFLKSSNNVKKMFYFHFNVRCGIFQLDISYKAIYFYFFLFSHLADDFIQSDLKKK